MGKYNPNNNAEIIKLLNGMTIDEKLDLLSLNFIQIWYRLWLSTSQQSQSYFNAKNKFESSFAVDQGVRLRKLVTKSAHAERVWEIPKGRKKNRTEPDIHCAVREFGEETGVQKKNYKMFPGAKRTYSYVDENTRYTNIYYIALAKTNVEPKIDFSITDQVSEVSDIRWMSIEDIRHIDRYVKALN
jgi:8-oxo-dGTP pyrophosphatase MutT (NUDIX family)